MTILVGSDVPGLLTALEQAVGGVQRLTVLHEAEAILAQVRDPQRRIDALILSDGLVPPAGSDIATALWQIVSFVARERQPVIPTVLTLRDDTPTAISDALRAEAQRTGGDLLLVPRSLCRADQIEAQQLIVAIVGSFAFESQRRSYTLVTVGNAGGVGTTSALIALNLQLARLGVRVLLVDCARGASGVATWLRMESSEKNNRVPVDEQGIIERIRHHQSGIDVLVAPDSPLVAGEIERPTLDTLLDALQPLHYDVVSFDGFLGWQERPDICSLLAQPTTSPLVVCPPGAKERTAARATLEALGAINRANGQTALDATMLLFIEGERGQIRQITDVKRDLLERYPMVRDLGTLPRDPALLSMITEGETFRSIFELGPKRPYAHAVRSAVRQWIQAVGLPPTWLIRPDPYERVPCKRLWWLRRRDPPSMPAPKHELVTEQQPEVTGDERYSGAEQPLLQESVVTTALHGTSQEADEMRERDTPSGSQALLPPEALPSHQVEATPATAEHAPDTNWLDTVRQHQRGRLFRVPIPEQGDDQ